MNTNTRSKNLYQKFVAEILKVLNAITELFYSPSIIFIALFGCLAFQVDHLAQFAHRNSITDRIELAYLFAITVELTALIQTIHSGKETTIRNFALLTFWTNILFYEVWVGFDITPKYFTDLISKVTLSAIIAYALYSYSELFFKNAKDAKQKLQQEQQLQQEKEREQLEAQRQAEKQRQAIEQSKQDRAYQLEQKRLEIEAQKAEEERQAERQRLAIEKEKQEQAFRIEQQKIELEKAEKEQKAKADQLKFQMEQERRERIRLEEIAKKEKLERDRKIKEELEAKQERERLLKKLNEEKERKAREQERKEQERELKEKQRIEQKRKNRLIDVGKESSQAEIKKAIKTAKSRITTAKYRIKNSEGNQETNEKNFADYSKELERLQSLIS